MKNWKRIGVFILAGIFFSIIALGLSACAEQEKIEESTPESIPELTQDTGSVEALEIRPSVAPAKMTVNEIPIDPVWYDFWYYNHFDQYIFQIPQNEKGEPDLTTLSGRTETETWADTLHALTMNLIQEGMILKARAITDQTKLGEAGITEIENFFQEIKNQAEQLGASDELILQAMYGELANVESLRAVIEDYFLWSEEAEVVKAEFTYSDDEVKTYYDEHQAELGDWELPVVRHILFETMEEITVEEDAAAKAAAEDTLAKIDAGEDMETLGNTLQSDGEALESAEYKVSKGEMVPEFEEWCFDNARKIGDTGIVKTDFGYHVMKLVSFSDQMEMIRSVMQDADYYKFIEDASKLPEFKIEFD